MSFRLQSKTCLKYVFFGRRKKLVKGFKVETELRSALLSDFQFYGADIRIVELPYTDDQFALYLFKAGIHFNRALIYLL